MAVTNYIPVHNKAGCWYFVYTWECLLCGKWEEDRQRMDGPKPKDYADRHEHREGSCGNHFG